MPDYTAEVQQGSIVNTLVSLSIFPSLPDALRRLLAAPRPTTSRGGYLRISANNIAFFANKAEMRAAMRALPAHNSIVLRVPKNAVQSWSSGK